MKLTFNLSNPLNNTPNGTYIKTTIIPMEEYLFKEDSGFCIYIVEDENEQSFQIKGTSVKPLTLKQTYYIEGSVSEFRGNKQLSFHKIRPTKPINKKGTIAYLQTLKGLKTKAELIYEEFGLDSIDMLRKEPMEVVKKIKGIGKKSALQWKEQLNELKDSQDVITVLLGYGLTVKQARKLHQLYNDEIVQIIEENPYRLSYEVKGYSFERCDQIARNIGINPKSQFRVEEGIRHSLEVASQGGHSFLPITELIEAVRELLTIRLMYTEMQQLLSNHREEDVILYHIGELSYEIPYLELKKQLKMYQQEGNLYKKEKLRYPVVNFLDEHFEDELKHLCELKEIVNEQENIYTRISYYEENKVAIYVNKLTKTIPFNNPIQVELELERYCKEKGYVLEERQKEAVLCFSEEKGGFFVLCGSAGCGKTFTLKIILEMIERQFKANKDKANVLLLAPTGKASKVASRSTSRECVTIHRGLGFIPDEGFEFNAKNPLDADLVVIDETSMMDLSITHDLLSAIKVGTKVIFLGDTQQLPSIGAGNVLKDLIESAIPKVVTLNVVKRQGTHSGIIRNANKIIAGEMIQDYKDTGDAFFIKRDQPESVIKTILQSMRKILTFDGYTIEDIQVLAPQRKGSVGTNILNYMIQQELNPDKPGEVTVLNKKFDVRLEPTQHSQTFELHFKIGDKVIHTKNNKEMPWYIANKDGKLVDDKETIGITNGECGIIENILRLKKNIIIYVNYEGKYVAYVDSFQEIDHAWALTIHKSQGSQWKALILPMMKQYFNMLDNNLFYTGYTRAESFNVVIGQAEAVQYAIRTLKSRTRYTNLSGRIHAVHKYLLKNEKANVS